MPDNHLQRWKAIVTAINRDPYARGRVIFDIMNEPDSRGLRWETSSSPHVPSIGTNYLRFMDMASSINRSALSVPATCRQTDCSSNRIGVPCMVTEHGA